MSRVSRRCWRQDLSAFWSSLSWRSRSVSEAWNGCKSSTWDVRWQQSSLGRRDSEGGRCGGVTRSGLPHESTTAKRDSPDTLRSRLMILELTFEHSINKGLRPARPQRTKREDAPVSAVPSSAAFGDCVLEGVLFEWYQLTFPRSIRAPRYTHALVPHPDRQRQLDSLRNRREVLELALDEAKRDLHRSHQLGPWPSILLDRVRRFLPSPLARVGLRVRERRELRRVEGRGGGGERVYEGGEGDDLGQPRGVLDCSGTARRLSSCAADLGRHDTRHCLDRFLVDLEGDRC